MRICLCFHYLQIKDFAGKDGSRPNFNYLFYVDFVGSLMDVRCQNALRHLQVRACAEGHVLPPQDTSSCKPNADLKGSIDIVPHSLCHVGARMSPCRSTYVLT